MEDLAFDAHSAWVPKNDTSGVTTSYFADTPSTNIAAKLTADGPSHAREYL